MSSRGLPSYRPGELDHLVTGSSLKHVCSSDRCADDGCSAPAHISSDKRLSGDRRAVARAASCPNGAYVNRSEIRSIARIRRWGTRRNRWLRRRHVFVFAIAIRNLLPHCDVAQSLS